MVCFAETLEVDDFPLPQESNGIPHIWIIGKAKDIIVRHTGFLLST